MGRAGEEAWSAPFAMVEEDASSSSEVGALVCVVDRVHGASTIEVIDSEMQLKRLDCIKSKWIISSTCHTVTYDDQLSNFIKFEQVCREILFTSRVQNPYH